MQRKIAPGLQPSMDRPVPPRSPRTHQGMVHFIHHRFSKMVQFKSVRCGLCEKPMFYGFKCKECKYRCHRDCVDKVPPSCGLPQEYMEMFKRSVAADGGRRSPLASYSGPSAITSPSSLKSEPITRDRSKRLKGHYSNPSLNVPFPPDSSSNTSSCTSSTHSSPAILVNSQPPYSASAKTSSHLFHFPDISNLATSSSNHFVRDHHYGVNSLGTSSMSREPKSIVKEFVETQKSNDSDKTISGASGSTSTDSEKTLAGRLDSQDSQVSDMDVTERAWPRQNSMSSHEWDIPYQQVHIVEELGTGLFGTVYKGLWHGQVAVKKLNLITNFEDGEADESPENKKILESFRQEVAMFRKTRHENLVLFMGACMKPPDLAIITSLCKGKTLYTHIHVVKDKFALNRTLQIAEQISQGMSYLHSRGIVHKDLKTKNIFYENGKVVITDFGLFSGTKLCRGKRQGGWLTIPKGWLCYLAPEVIRRLRADDQQNEELPFSEASDVYAFGTVWYELLLGDWPIKGQPSEAIVWQVGKGIKQSLTNLQASKEITDLLMICWAFIAGERPQFSRLLETLSKLPKKRLQRSPSHPIQMLRSAESIF